jgi:hypothetical protein
MPKTPVVCWNACRRRAERAREAWRVVLCLSLPALTTEASAADTVQVTIVDHGDAALGRQLRAEASYAGFSVSAASDTLAGESPPAARVRILSGERVELELLGPDGTARAGGELARLPGDEDAFALRVVEHLRARLVELGWSLPSQPPSLPASAASQDDATTEREAGLPPEPPAAPGVDRADESDTASELATPESSGPLLWLGAGAAACAAAGGLGVIPHAVLGARAEPSPRWGLSLDAFVPLAAGEIEDGEGSASARWYAVIAGVDLSLGRRAPWFASVGLGAGLLLLDISAQGRAGFTARDDRSFAGAAQLAASAGWRILDRWRLRASAHTGLSAPRPVLRFDGREVASLGRWYGGVGLSFEGAFELGAGTAP